MNKTNRFYRPLCGFIAVFLASLASAQLLINPPTFPSSNTVELTLSNAASTNAQIIFFTPDLTVPLAAWTRLTTGTVGQVTFDLTRPTNADAFFAAGVAPIATPTVATPVFTPGGGSYATPTNVVVTCGTPGAAIYYTTDGSTPTTSSTYIYNGGSIYLSSVTTLKAKAFAIGYNDSAVATATYTINSPPFVYAGAQQIISSSPTTLQGVVTDDGLTGGGIKFTNWTKVSGPGTVTFGNSHQTNSTAGFSANGIYILQLSACDGQYTNSSQVTIAYNSTLSVSMSAPADGSSYTVPTNILLQATATCSSGSVTQLLFYANSTLIGTADTSSGNTFSLQWKNVSSGNLALTAVAQTTDTNNFSLASSPVNITVNWPTNVGQVTLAQTDLQIPAAGLPITVNRQYNTQYGTVGSFGNNGRLDYETIKIQESSASATGWQGTSGGLTYTIKPSVQHLITVTLTDGSQYYFVAQLVFDQNDSPSINSAVTPDCYNFYTVHLVCTPLGQGQLSVAAPSDSVGMDDQLTGWNQPLTAVHFDDTGFPTGNYEPDFSQFAFTAPDGTKYSFYSNGTVASKTDRNGNSLAFSSSGISSSTGRQVTFTRDGNNRVTDIYDPIAINTSGSPVLVYSYDSIGNLTNVARLVQRSPAIYQNTSYAYTNAAFPNNITSITDPRGIISQRYEYDSEGRLYKQYDAYGRAITYSYDTANHQQTVIDRNNYSTTQTFTPSGQLASVQNAVGVTTYGYDSQGNQIAETNELGQVTTLGYDNNNNLTGITNEISVVSSTTYNQFGQPLVAIDALGYGTTNFYDSNGNLLFKTNALGVVTTYGYDSQGNRIAQTNAPGLAEQVVIQNQYDQYGDTTNTTTLNGQHQLVSSTSYTYDDNGNKLTETKTRTLPGGGNGAVFTRWSYDAANRIIQTMDANGFTNSVIYNGIGKDADTIDPLGRTNQFFYDAAGTLTNETFPDATFERYAYDANGNRTNFVDRANHSISYTYDPLGRLLQTTYADGNYTVNSYDAAGRLKRTTATEVISGGGMAPPVTISEVTSYGYDAAGRRTNTVNALNQVTRYAYDDNGNQTAVIDALNHTNIYLYDALNRQIERIYPDNTSESYGYNALGNRIVVTNQANVVARYGYDAAGRLVAVTNAFGTSQQVVTRYVYDEVGNLLQQIDALNHTNRVLKNDFWDTFFSKTPMISMVVFEKHGFFTTLLINLNTTD